MDECGEFFEITFFMDKKKANEEKGKRKIDKLLEKYKEQLQSSKEPKKCLFPKYTLFEYFERKGMFEYRCNISHLIITRENFEEIKNQMFQMVNDIFKMVSSIEIAVGVYELSYYLTEHISCIQEFNKEVLSKFPFVFLRNPSNYGLFPTVECESVSCIVQLDQKVQHIFSEYEICDKI